MAENNQEPIDYTEGRSQPYPCGSSEICRMEVLTGISCASSCEYHDNYKKQQETAK